MRRHEDFEELAALAAIGQLTSEEHRELTEHLHACDGCRRANDQFNFILDQLPLPDPSGSDKDLQTLHGESYRKRFLEKASAQGVRFTPEALGERRLPVATDFLKLWRPYGLGFGSAVAMIILVAAFAFRPPLSRFPFRQRTALTSEVAPPTNIGGTNASVSTTDSGTVGEAFSRLQKKERDDEKRLEVLRRELARAHVDYSKLSEESERWKNQTSQLESKTHQNQEQLAEVKSQLDKLSKDNDQLTASLVADRFRIKELSDEVENQKAAVERERQLTAAARDVRDLMGARNLHIIDVADLDGHGKSRKSFGRVFYTEGKSLIFYAFDLSQKGSAAKVSFQAWGQHQGSGNDVKNLGVFHIDDQAQKRWVLRVDNPELLKSVESLFVTVEPAPGREKPSGQKLLYAYLGTQANHP